MMLILAGVFFIAFTLNVSMGSITGSAVLSDVQEMILLFVTATCFAVAVLQKEAKAQKSKD
jgi:hypothetical protein